jgi:hypothetical protein
MDGSKRKRRKLKRVRLQCNYGCCLCMGNWNKYYKEKKLKQVKPEF